MFPQRIFLREYQQGMKLGPSANCCTLVKVLEATVETGDILLALPQLAFCVCQAPCLA
jgi:hypothetical protein